MTEIFEIKQKRPAIVEANLSLLLKKVWIYLKKPLNFPSDLKKVIF